MSNRPTTEIEKLLQFIFEFFFPNLDVEGIRGDIEEGYLEMYERFGKQKARAWLFIQILHGAFSIIVFPIKNIKITTKWHGNYSVDNTETSTKPPAFAEWLLQFAFRLKNEGAEIGDLEERFAKKVQVEGSPKACRWYWRQAGSNLLDLLKPERWLKLIRQVFDKRTMR